MKRTLTERIIEAYQQHPQASGEEILQIIGVTDNKRSRQALVKAQQRLRGYSAPERHNQYRSNKRYRKRGE